MCPARNAICDHCALKGHYQAVCQKKKRSVNYVQEGENQDHHYQPDDFLGSINKEQVDVGGVNANNFDPRMASVRVDKTQHTFRVDTGADSTVIPKSVYDDKFSHKILRPATMLRGPDMQPLRALGFFKAVFKHRDYTVMEDIYVLQQGASLLSYQASVRLSLVKLTVCEVSKDIQNSYPTLFTGLGKLGTEYDIKIDSTIEPYAISTPRRVPLPLMASVKEELERLESLDVIMPVQEPTPWRAPIVVVPKSNSQVRICVDLTKLNRAVQRERHILPSVDHVLGQMAGAAVFTKLDANSGFHQIQLSPRSQLLTTFITPFGRFAYKRLPFGVSSGPEYFQREMSRILEGLEGIVCLMDDIVIFGRDQPEHDIRLRAAMDKLVASGITLNKDKCEFNKSQIEFVGQLVGRGGITASPDKISAITAMSSPKDIHELRRFMGMVNQLGKFVPTLADSTEPLRGLLSNKNAWHWGPSQDKGFQHVKDLLTSSPILALYDVKLPTKVSADSSSYGLGAVITQEHSEGWRPVAYASRTLTSAETRYAQIEKEALASTWACEKFEDYLLGLKFTLETDHKPLVPLLGQKDIEQLPPRLQRLRLRLMRYTFDIIHVPGRELYTADTLSRAPQSTTTETNILEQDVAKYVNMIVQGLPASDTRLAQIRQHQQEDEVCRKIISYCQDGWPDRSHLNGIINHYWPYRSEITFVEELLMYGARVIVPASLRLDMLDRLHEGHQGINKCRLRPQQSVWWPGLSRQISELISNCRTCCQLSENHPEPLQPSHMPDGPWLKLATDLFEYQRNSYLLLIDYYSRYIEIAKLNDTTSATVITHMKSIFARFGIPQSVISDNGPQYSSREFATFAHEYGFTHIPSSPGHPSGNGEAERAVRTIKQLLRGGGDPYAALLNYRATPIANGYSPAELLMSRRLRTKLPVISSSLKPKSPDSDILKEREENYRLNQKWNFDKHHAVKPLSSLSEGQEVWLPDRKQHGNVSGQYSDRSYYVTTDTGQYRRNRVQLNRMPNNAENQDDVHNHPAGLETCSSEPVMLQPNADVTPKATSTRSGRVVKAPDKFQDYQL